LEYALHDSLWYTGQLNRCHLLPNIFYYLPQLSLGLGFSVQHKLSK